jgi:hypothetical protein
MSQTDKRIYMISYLLANGKMGNITDPQALRTFFNRVIYNENYQAKEKDNARRETARRLAPQLRAATQARQGTLGPNHLRVAPRDD